MIKAVFDIGPQGRQWYLRKNGVLVLFYNSVEEAVEATEKRADLSRPCIVKVKGSDGRLVKQREYKELGLDIDEEWIIIEDLEELD